MNKKNEMVYVKVDSELNALIEKYRHTFERIPNRSEAIRQLIEYALTEKGFPRK